MNLPILLTLFRLLAIPAIVLVHYIHQPWSHALSAVIFLVAAFTDWLDGYIARERGQTTKLGAFLDPVADKLLVSTALILIIVQHYIPDVTIPAIVIIGREILISALREWMAEMGKRTSVAVSFIAKIKTFMQMFALILLLWYHPQSPQWILWAGVALLYVAALLTLWTMLMYLKVAWPDLTLSGEQ